MQPISIYIHWPYCSKKCPYCDFNSFVTDKIDYDKWESAYIKAIDSYREIIAGRKIKTIFFGGGTPSLATPNIIESIINKLNAVGNFSDAVEITLEANPTSVEARKFSEFRQVGVNRVSLGIQSLRDDNLKFLGRNHSANEAIAAIEAVKENFDNYSLDFIYALPHQKLSDWEEELTEAIALASNHLSFYQLTIENGTKFGAMAKAGLLNEIDEEVAAEMFDLTYEITKSHNFHRYEVSNHARPGFESLHNLNYWQYGDYIGIGPGAHGRYNKFMTIDVKQPELWIKQVFDNGNGIDVRQNLSEEDIRIEKIIMGMRINCGIDISLVNDFGTLIADQLVVIEDGRVKTTNLGVKFLNSVIKRIA
jgi:putative oxygen-independent coproporphyrinogen III oxidase